MKSKNAFKLLTKEIVILLLLSTISIYLFNCAHTLEYGLTKDDKIISSNFNRYKALVIQFKDARPKEEKSLFAKEELYITNSRDYTSDEEFNGIVSVEISKMIAKHLDYAQLFNRVFSSSSSYDTSDSQLMERIHKSEIDFILTGEIKNFYGYYETNLGREFLIGFGSGLILGGPFLLLPQYKDKTITTPVLNYDWSTGRYSTGTTSTTVKEYDPLPLDLASLGFLVGSYIGTTIENNIERNMEWRTNLKFDLIDAKSKLTILNDSVDVFNKIKLLKPSEETGKNKFDLALKSLREAVDLMLKKINSISL